MEMSSLAYGSQKTYTPIVCTMTVIQIYRAILFVDRERRTMETTVTIFCLTKRDVQSDIHLNRAYIPIRINQCVTID